MSAGKREQKQVVGAYDIGGRLREARLGRGLTQAQLATRLGKISQPAIYKYESGKAPIPLSTLLRFSKELGVRTEWLIEGTGPMRPSSSDADRIREERRAWFEGLRFRLLSEITDVMKEPDLEIGVQNAFAEAVSRLRGSTYGRVNEGALTEFLRALVRGLLRASDDIKFAIGEARRAASGNLEWPIGSSPPIQAAEPRRADRRIRGKRPRGPRG